MAYDVQAKSVEWNPPAARIRELAEKMPNAVSTEFGNVNVKARVDSRSSTSTYVVTGDPTITDSQTVSREEYDRLAAHQDAYIAEQEMLVVDGYIGNDSEFRTRARLVIESANANVAGMQQHLYYPLEEGEDAQASDPVTTVVYTPNLVPLPKPDGSPYPRDRAILVDLDNGITRVMNSDYFGESKKGGLRMWNKLVHDRGGLPMHAGCKIIPGHLGGGTMLIVGLSGTGKTTTTFTKQLESKPVQDDFIALMPGGKVYGTENGCFAKTFGLDPRFEPAIHSAATRPDAYLENVSVDENGKVDFFDRDYTENGRCTFPFSYVDPFDARELKPAEFLLILNRNDNLMPGVARLDRAQAAAYFMLGETKGTSAGGKDEMGKALRVPGTNPFFPLRHAQQGNRFLELLDNHDLSVYVLNTGRVGGGEGTEGSKKIEILHSSAFVQAIVQSTISWEQDPDFGYEVATSVPGIDDEELLQPRRLYQRLGRMEEYDAIVARLKRERVEHLRKYEGLAEEIVKSVA